MCIFICIFGEIVNGVIHLNEAGHIVAWTWQGLPNHVPNGIWDAFVVMPNSVHGTIIITSRTPATKSYGLAEIVCQFKNFSARRTIDLRGTPGSPVWQRNYYEHIIRSKESLHRIRDYTLTNPLRWHLDRKNAPAIRPVSLNAEWYKRQREASAYSSGVGREGQIATKSCSGGYQHHVGEMSVTAFVRRNAKYPTAIRPSRRVWRVWKAWMSRTRVLAGISE
jgi:putative transposase